MHSKFNGEAIYIAEQDAHFPQLTVGETLEFTALARAPRHIPGDADRRFYAQYIRDVLMAMFGMRHTINTKVCNDYVRGVSGGERKRVSIIEAALNGLPLQCWENSTRSLDSAKAVDFCKNICVSARLAETTAAVAMYRAPRASYDLFNKVLVLYQGQHLHWSS
ncbi:hypothetical protein EDB80DRAFT_749363 [Ilyonectria destructans]|nr:hypothetical protein EDB80DRAFT_749363 [Ilyonectria destructans]